MDDGDIVCHPILVLPFLRDFDVANARVGNRLKTEVICHVNDLDAAPPEWRIGDVRSMAKTSAVTDGSNTLPVAVGSRQFIADQLRVWELAVSTTSCGFTATQSWRNKVLQRSTTRAGSGQATLECRPVWNWFQKSGRHRCLHT